VWGGRQRGDAVDDEGAARARLPRGRLVKEAAHLLRGRARGRGRGRGRGSTPSTSTSTTSTSTSTSTSTTVPTVPTYQRVLEGLAQLGGE